ncbi:MAG TPA: hypothetical protein VK745_15075 [Polyangiaceae bacterium]|jgi:hypothetical protein|nr:hypothetical protein [Polyangiaceae bacterium]
MSSVSKSRGVSKKTARDRRILAKARKQDSAEKPVSDEIRRAAERGGIDSTVSRNSYEDALAAELGLSDPRALETPMKRHRMTAGDLFARYLSPIVTVPDLTCALTDLAEEVRAVNMSLELYANDEGFIDPANGDLAERLDSLAVRLEVMSELHRRAVDRLSYRGEERGAP